MATQLKPQKNDLWNSKNIVEKIRSISFQTFPSQSRKQRSFAWEVLEVHHWSWAYDVITFMCTTTGNFAKRVMRNLRTFGKQGINFTNSWSLLKKSLCIKIKCKKIIIKMLILKKYKNVLWTEKSLEIYGLFFYVAPCIGLSLTSLFWWPLKTATFCGAWVGYNICDKGEN